jgi:hypothetical protein
MRRRFVVPDPSKSPSDYAISALYVDKRGWHEYVTVYSRGGLAGSLTLGAGDAARIAACCGLAEEEAEGGD